MALKKSFTSDHAFNFPASYWRVVQAIDLNNGSASVITSGFADQAARQSNGLPVGSLQSRFDIAATAGDSLVDKAYNHLKTLPQFSGAIDA